MPESNQLKDLNVVVETDDMIQTEFDWDSVPPSIAVVETVSIAADTDPIELEPLYGSVDSDALDELIRSNGTSSSDGATTVSFTFVGYEVGVHSNGTVVVRSIDDD